MDRAWRLRAIDEAASARIAHDLRILPATARCVVARDIGRSTKCFLIIEHDGEQYVGTLLISDAAANAFFYRFLQGQTGRTIKDIGELEVSHTL